MARYLRDCGEFKDPSINHMLHALGCGNRKTYKRWGKEFYRPYRNYYDCGPKRSLAWDVMVAQGYAKCIKLGTDKGTDYWYKVTEKGLEYLSEVTGVHFYPEEK